MTAQYLKKIAVGVDIGGTFIKLGLVRGKRVLVREKLSTAAFMSPKELQDGIVDAVHLLVRRSKARIEGVGVGIPGLVRFPSGVVRSCVNIPGWKDVPLRDLLKKRLHVEVQVENDVNVMALAEWVYGAGRGVSNLVCLTLGTGVGGGLVLDGRLYRGMSGSAGEIGHMPLNETGPSCPCGGRACLERYVGNSEIVDWVLKRLEKKKRGKITALLNGRLEKLTPEVIDRAARMGDTLALDAWKQAGGHIGVMLASVVNLLNPEKIVIGGGISNAGDLLFEPIRDTFRKRAMRGSRDVPIVPAELGSSAGLIGAALLVHHHR